jgi:hypothetical protein
MTTNPGFADQARKRTILRVVGFVLLAVGLVIAVRGGMLFLRGFTSGDIDDTSGLTGILMLGGGGFLCIFGLAFLNAGFLGATARYGAGETMPVVKDSAAYLSDGQGVLGVGRTVDDQPAAAAGPFCAKCGVRNDATARFCDSCGSSLG